MPQMSPGWIAFAALLGLAGGAMLIDSRAQRREAEWVARTPPAGRMIVIEEHRVHVHDAGAPHPDAPDLVLIHGANGNLRDFTFDLVDRLREDFRVIAVDRPGLGYSDSFDPADSDPREQARVLRLALAQLDVRRPIVLGHSYGGAVAMGWALQAEEDTAALVLLAGATYPWPGSLGGWYRLNATPLGRPARALVTALAPQSLVSSVMDAVFTPAPVPDGFVAHFGPALSLRRETQANNTRQVNALLAHVRAMSAAYSALSLPIEIVHGDADTIVDLDTHSRRMAREIASAHLVVIDGAGHMPHHSHPEVVVAAIWRAARRAGRAPLDRAPQSR